MSEIRLTKLKISNYRSFKESQTFEFPNATYKKPISIIGYNNSGKTNLMNAILYGIGEKFINAKTFEVYDLHNLSYENQIEIKTRIEATPYGQNQQTIAGDRVIKTEMVDNELKSSIDRSFFGANKYYNIFYINFHKIKDEISIKKSSWGSLTSFLAKHIRKIVDTDESMLQKKEAYNNSIKDATGIVLNESTLNTFIEKVKSNYSSNLRNNNCEVEFGLPAYEDIFLQMIFKIALNGNEETLIPINQFGDGYISMFVMAVIQSVAETNLDDKCLFLFEEPESFLHENHQEYFYKMVLCQLAEKGHQIIYTTHSDKMIDIFDTKSIIRIEYDEIEKKTVKKYNNINDLSIENPIISISNFNNFIKAVEPNLNKILFSRKVILVEGPNDLLSYNFAIEKKVSLLNGDLIFAKSYLNFKNIAILVHHGKATASILIAMCNHFGLDYFIINDWDFEEDFINTLKNITTEEDLKRHYIYTNENNGEPRNSSRKGMITTNWKLLKKAQEGKIHFNIPRLEEILGYSFNDKSSIGIWEKLNQIDSFSNNFFPDNLFEFLELHTLVSSDTRAERAFSAR